MLQLLLLLLFCAVLIFDGIFVVFVANAVPRLCNFLCENIK
jgi:hypothetical protein